VEIRRIQTFEKCYLAFIFIFILLIVVMVFLAFFPDENPYKNECEARGGVYLTINSNKHVCVKEYTGEEK